MMPILYEATETTFASNGVGVLSDAISCRVTEERNGAYELVMQYPISGIHYAEIGLRSIVLAKPNPTTQSQPFRVYRITRPINGIVEVYAEHISYDLSGIPIMPFTSSTIQEAFQKLKSYSAVQNPFVFYTDKTTIANMSVSAPCSLRSQLGGKSGSILDVYGGGEYEFDRYNVNLYQHRGMNRGVSIRYGKNLTDLKQEQNCANVYTGVYPYWVDSQTGTIVQLSTPIVPVEGTFNFDRVLTLDLSSEYQNAPTQEQLYNRTLAYIEQNQIGVPKVNLDVSFVQLEQSDEYKGMALLDRVSLCDEVNIYFDKLGVNATAKAIKIVYNSLLDRIESVELGDSRTKFTDTVLKQEQANENVLNRNDVASMIDQLTAQILGANGGVVRLLDDNGDGVPDTLYIADNADPAQAVKVWRFNYLGWGASSNGYNGPFTLGATLENGIIANFITAGILNANLIKAGIIQDKTEKNFWNMDTGAFQISSTATVEGSGGSGNPDKTITQIANSARSEAEATAASALASAVQTLNGQIDDLQGQIDGSITTWFYGYDPAVNLYPSIDWTTTELKNQHLGDLFYNTVTGSCWRWMLENNVYSWQRITDTEVSKAIADAAKAQTTADSKRRVFLSTPTVPYDSGDLWFDSTTKDLLTCTQTRESGVFNDDDWAKLTKYTDDSALSAFVNGTYATFVTSTTQAINGKITTYYQDEAPGTANTGDLWIDTDNKNQLYRWNGTTWVLVRDAGIQEAMTAASNAQTTADGKIVTFAQASTPTATDIGDLWIDTDDNNKLYRWNGTNWVVMSDSSALNTWLTNTYASDKSALESQIDKKAETWYQTTDPSTAWTTDALKAEHVGDLWYNSSSNVQKYYRYNGTGWSELTATPPDAVFDEIDGKAQIFVSTPTPPYNVGDLWVQGIEGDIYKCKTTKASSGSYDSADWELASKYTDDSLAEQQAGMIAVNQTAIKNLQDRIESTVSKTTYDADMAKKADTTYVQSTLQSVQTQTAEAIENRFSESKTYTDNAVGEYRQLKEDVYAWQRFSADGMEIGKSNSPFKTRLSNSKLSFLENDTEVAYIGESALNITNARVRQVLSVGTETDGWFDWVMGVDGLTMKWKG